MARAIWNGVVLAESDRCECVEWNHYFPPESLDRRYFKSSDMHTVCPWKGTASYYDLEVAERRIGAPPGTIPRPRRMRSTSRATWPFGRV